MKLAIVHYHLKPGGVTRVIAEQVEMLASIGWQAAVLTGEPSTQLTKLQQKHIPGLAYDGPDTDLSPAGLERRSSELARSLELAAADCAAILFHNALLEKNSALLPAIQQLRDSGKRILMHVHDLAEDGRPRVYAAADYPSGVEYICINSRDRNIFLAAGVPQNSLHLLPNTVAPLPRSQSKTPPKQLQELCSGRPYILAPVRAIPRKNIGELTAISLLRPERPIVLTLAPNNPRDFTSYSEWKKLSAETAAHIVYEASEHIAFEELISHAEAVITASVQEGFGFSFIEPWTVGLPVFGRRIPGIIDDMEAAGLQFPQLYNALRIPCDLVPIDGLWRRWIGGAAHRLISYRKRLLLLAQLDPSTLEHSMPLAELDDLVDRLPAEFEQRFAETHIDFARMDTRTQMEVCLQLAQSADARKRVLAENALLNDLTSARPGRPEIAKNHSTIAGYYGPHHGAQRLLAILNAKAPTAGAWRFNKAGILRTFLNLDFYFPCASEPRNEHAASIG